MCEKRGGGEREICIDHCKKAHLNDFSSSFSSSSHFPKLTSKEREGDRDKDIIEHERRRKEEENKEEEEERRKVSGQVIAMRKKRG